MNKAYKQARPPLKHESLRSAVWLPNQTDLVISARDGVWRYKDVMSSDIKKELIVYEEDSKYKFSRIFEIKAIPYTPEYIIYQAGTQIGRLNLNTGETNPFAEIADFSSFDCKFTADGRYTVIGEIGMSLKIWDNQLKTLLAEEDRLVGPISDIQDNKFLCCSSDFIDEIVEYDLSQMRAKPLLKHQRLLELSGRDFIETESIFRLGDKIITTHYKEAIRVWDGQMRAVLYEWPLQEFEPSDHYELTTDQEKHLLVLAEDFFVAYNVESGEKINLSMAPHEFGSFLDFQKSHFSLLRGDKVYFYELIN